MSLMKGEEASGGRSASGFEPQPAKALWLGAISLQESLRRQAALKDRLLFPQKTVSAPADPVAVSAGVEDAGVAGADKSLSHNSLAGDASAALASALSGAEKSPDPVGSPAGSGIAPASADPAGSSQRGDDSSPAGFFMGFEPLSPVVTMGVRAGEDDLLPGRLKERGLSLMHLKRGGRATIHAPGQAVIYPVLPLRLYSLKIKDYIVRLEKCAQAALLSFGVQTRNPETEAGLFTSTGKIAFFGVHISQGISQHGAAFNVSNSLDLFSAVRSCGVAERQHDSLLQRGVSLTPKEFFYAWTAKAAECFPLKKCEE